MIHLKIEEVAGKTAIVLDDAMLARLGASLGDTLTVDEKAVTVEGVEGETQRQLELARAVMKDYRETLEVLAR